MKSANIHNHFTFELTCSKLSDEKTNLLCQSEQGEIYEYLESINQILQEPACYFVPLYITATHLKEKF